MINRPDDSDDLAAWSNAAAYVAENGDLWPDRAITHLRKLAAGEDTEGFNRWLDLMTKMSEIAETSRQ